MKEESNLPRVTYLLGAGASYNCLPLVKNMPSKMMDLAKKVKETEIVLPDYKKEKAPELKRLKDLFVKNLEELAQTAKGPFTVDTLAKKYDLQEDYDNLETLKIMLSLFFIIEQKLNSMDERYAAFLAAILENQGDRIKIPGHIKFLSWNYDFQFELAAQSYLGNKKIKEIQKEIGSYPAAANPGSPSIVHLNGIAGLYKSSNKAVNDIFDRETEKNDLSDHLQNTLELYDWVRRRQVGLNQYFSFAWEDSPISEEKLAHAKNIASETEYLVIIGYSFPFFNRQIDCETFSDMTNLKKIYYQDPEANTADLKRSLAIPEQIDVIPIRDKDKFFIPHEL